MTTANTHGTAQSSGHHTNTHTLAMPSRSRRCSKISKISKISKKSKICKNGHNASATPCRPFLCSTAHSSQAHDTHRLALSACRLQYIRAIVPMCKPSEFVPMLSACRPLECTTAKVFCSLFYVSHAECVPIHKRHDHGKHTRWRFSE